MVVCDSIWVDVLEFSGGGEDRIAGELAQLSLSSEKDSSKELLQAMHKLFGLVSSCTCSCNWVFSFVVFWRHICRRFIFISACSAQMLILLIIISTIPTPSITEHLFAARRLQTPSIPRVNCLILAHGSWGFILLKSSEVQFYL